MTGRFATWRWISWATQLISTVPVGFVERSARCLPGRGRAQVLHLRLGVLAQDVLPGDPSSSSARIHSSSSLRWRAAGAATLSANGFTPRSSMWIEEKIEGNRSQRMKLDQAPSERPQAGHQWRLSLAPGARCPLDGLHPGRLFHAHHPRATSEAATFSFGPWESSGSVSTAASPTCSPG